MEAFATRYDTPPNEGVWGLHSAKWVVTNTAAIAAERICSVWRSSTTWLGDKLHLENAKEYTAKVGQYARDTVASASDTVGSGVKSGVDTTRKQLSACSKPGDSKRGGCEVCCGQQKLCLVAMAGVVAALSFAGYTLYVKKVKSKNDKKKG